MSVTDTSTSLIKPPRPEVTIREITGSFVFVVTAQSISLPTASERLSRVNTQLPFQFVPTAAVFVSHVPESAGMGDPVMLKVAFWSAVPLSEPKPNNVNCCPVGLVT